jgi:hypothetical protein
VPEETPETETPFWLSPRPFLEPDWPPPDEGE